MNKNFLIGLVIVLIGAAVLGRRWWLKSTAEVAALAAGPPPAAVVPDSNVVVLTGRAHGGGAEPVLARTTGRIRTVFFAEGDYVRRGAVLAKLANFTFILAPHDGFMGPRQLVMGQYVNRKTVVSTISKHPYVLVPVALPPDFHASLHPGDSVRVWAQARPAVVMTGVAGAVPATGDTAAAVEIRLPTRAPLRIGEVASIQLHR